MKVGLWDFGMINALRKKLNFNIFPAEPPNDNDIMPYMIFDIKEFGVPVNSMLKVSTQMTVVDKQEKALAIYDYVRVIKGALRHELVLRNRDFVVGTARMKIDKVSVKGNKLILDITTLMWLKQLYADDCAELEEKDEEMSNE